MASAGLTNIQVSHIGRSYEIINVIILTLYAQTPQNGQTHSSNSSADGNELFECDWSFCGVGAQRIKNVDY